MDISNDETAHVTPYGKLLSGSTQGIAEPARYLALKVISRKFKLQPGKIQSDVPLAYCGWQIEYEDEDPEIRRILRKNARNPARR